MTADTVTCVKRWSRWLMVLSVFVLTRFGAMAEERPPTQAVVRLEVVVVTPDNGRLRKQRVTGSGVIISTEGCVLTNCHVVRRAGLHNTVVDQVRVAF